MEKVMKCDCSAHLISVESDDPWVEIAFWERQGIGDYTLKERIRLAWRAFRGRSTNEILLRKHAAREFGTAVLACAMEVNDE